MSEDINCRDLYRLLKRAIGIPLAGGATIEATAGMLSHLFTLALEGETCELGAWLSNDAVLQSWIDGQSPGPIGRADNDLLPVGRQLLAETA